MVENSATYLPLLTSTLSFIAALAVTFIGIRNSRLDRVREIKYKLKYDACLDALAVIDAHFSHIFDKDVPLSMRQYTTPEKARLCHNNLILSCDNHKIVGLFMNLMCGQESPTQDKQPPTKLLNEFRNVIRKELSFGAEELPLDQTRAWLGVIKCCKLDETASTLKSDTVLT